MAQMWERHLAAANSTNQLTSWFSKYLCNMSKLNMTPHDECNKPHVDEGGVISRLQSLEGHKMSL